LKVLGVASIAYAVCVLGGGFYGLYLGIPFADLIRFFLPAIVVGFVLQVAANVWKHYVDTKSVT
jgi:hypothetical protein